MPDFHVYGFSCLLPLLACYFGFCESIDLSDRELTEPGVIVGIIVGVVGVLVIVGVSILLCRLFCCKETACCSCCCKEEETYLEAGTAPIKNPDQESSPPDNNRAISTVSQNHHHHTTTTTNNARPSRVAARKATQDSDMPLAASLVGEYDDLPQGDWKLADVLKNKASRDPERMSKESLSSASTRLSETASVQAAPDGREEMMPDILSESGAAKRSDGDGMGVRRKLRLGPADLSGLASSSPSPLSPHSDFLIASSEHSERSKKPPRNVNAVPARQGGREFPRHQKRHIQSSPHEDDDVLAMESRSQNEASEAREFPLLEFEPRKHRSYYPADHVSRRNTREETHGGDDYGGFRPVDFDREPHKSPQPPCPAPRIRMERTSKEANTRETREFPLLEYGAEHRGFNPSHAAMRTLEETGRGGDEDWEFRPVQFDYRHPQSMQPFYQPRSMEPSSYQPRSMEPSSYQPRSMEPSSYQPRSMEASYQPQSMDSSYQHPQSINSYQPQSMDPYQPQSMEPSSYQQAQSMEPSYESRSMDHPSYPDYRSREWAEEEGLQRIRARDNSESLPPRAPTSPGSGNPVAGTVPHFTAASIGSDNLAFNHESAETTV